MERYRSNRGHKWVVGYHDKQGKKPHKIRTTCTKCTPGRETKNSHRFHGYGSFEQTHHTYCTHNCCGAQNDSNCYRKGQLHRKGKRKTKKRKSSKVKYSSACCVKKSRKAGSTIYVSFSGKNTRRKPKNWLGL